MRKITLLIIGTCIALFALQSCKKSDINGFPDGKGLNEGSYLVLDSVINKNLNFSDPAATVSIKVGSKGAPVATIKVFVATGSNANDSSGWALIKTVPYADGVVLSVSTLELNTALGTVGSSVQPGTSYSLQNVVVTSDGRTFSVTNTPTNFVSLAGYNMALTWGATAVCAFNASDAAGTYSVVTDGWADYKLGTLIQVTAGPGPNEVSVPIYPGPLGPGVNTIPAIVDVDPVSDIATINAQPTGYYGSVAPGNLATISGSGLVFSCTGYMTFVMNINVPAFGGLYSGYTFTIQKQ